MEEKQNKKSKILIVILVILVLGLAGYIVYDKVIVKEKEEVKKEERTEEPKKEEIIQSEWDLSAVPKTEEACTYNINLADLSSNSQDIREVKKLCEGKLTKYIVDDVKVDGIKQDVEVLSYMYADGIDTAPLDKLSGLYLNGKRVSQTISFNTWLKLSIHNNMLFVVIDGGTSVTGYVNVLAFDKMGKEVYNLETDLKQSNIIEPISSEPNKMVTVQDISRIDSVNINDGEFTFNSYMTQGFPCVNGYRGSTYKVTYDNTNFGKITRIGGWKLDNDSCTESYN